MAEYYIDSNGRPFETYPEKVKFLYMVEDNKVFTFKINGEKVITGLVKAASFPGYVKDGLAKIATDEILKQFNISKIADGYYADSKRKGFGVWQTIGNKKKRSIYLMSRNGGDWETVMISGPDFSNDFKKDSPEAISFDAKVENGEWIKVEVEVK